MSDLCESVAWREAAANAVRQYLRSDPERCMPTCRVGCPCDGGMQDAATGAPDAAQEIVEIVLANSPLRGPFGGRQRRGQ